VQVEGNAIGPSKSTFEVANDSLDNQDVHHTQANPILSFDLFLGFPFYITK
jgi:hypothetical protein